MSGMAPVDRLTPVDEAVGQTVYYDDTRGTYHMWCDDSEYDPVTTSLPIAISSITDVEPAELEPLADSIDPDALDTLVTDWRQRSTHRIGERTGSISFLFAQHGVTIHDDGEIVIDPQRTDIVG
ncbi:uncharacterized protein Nmag_2826 [Natrialba magadii ATCC 43099]|uniref:Halobacterial output domain-containing protein n=1 Tax=Natrialba magadii (strain ATCC 43099 / DSM 3394 / CCM 3739 / CIP 104546 / IAM 13178 / JCM 8861 / NBRC 102185 / NCIMB 2190 / MS3) TaxID=547559 RepID=D3SZX0_NATMM|nr:HalOD1 output domain-containing protein [Natrialba magadii]ADD06380.1 uncharacterized protein Nmag_2826 [Natrialba magadii ATCC 43099]ELY31477.1 hypothetical protein C500_06276 [Natrialba magadii ATCC 43099]